MRTPGRRRADHRRVYKLCSLALCYPDEDLLAARAQLRAVADELPRSPAAEPLRRFCGWWAAEDPLGLQQHYVETFDLDRRCSLYLTFYGEGDRRQRGLALLRLKRLYRRAGLPLQDAELPDFLPVMLEFASAAPDGHGPGLLREHRAALELLRASLRECDTPYADVIEAVTATLGTVAPAERARALALAAAGPPSEQVGLEILTPPAITGPAQTGQAG